LTGHDPDGDPMTFLIDSIIYAGPTPLDPGPFFVNRNPDGSFDFTGGPAGTWEIKFRVFDGSETSSQVTFTITTA
jgi:hypothetical protein